MSLGPAMLRPPASATLAAVRNAEASLQRHLLVRGRPHNGKACGLQRRGELAPADCHRRHGAAPCTQRGCVEHGGDFIERDGLGNGREQLHGRRLGREQEMNNSHFRSSARNANRA